MEPKPVYSTWIRASKIRLFWSLTAVLVLGAAGLTTFVSPLFAALFLLALPFAYIAVVISMSAFAFAPRGGDLQNKIHRWILEASPRSGRILDIGCGSGRLAIQLARGSSAEVVGIDFWGDDWEYSQSQCQNNARLEGVPGITFVKASASKLPFEDASFTAVVSCLTFHEVADVDRKVDSLAEALRVLAPGGTFVFFDLFADPRYYPDQGEIAATLRGQHGRITSVENLSDVVKLGFPLNTGKVLKYAQRIVGTKEAQP